ncbi:unnamed protein product [Symbiodinium sp. CCMP2592]|nr:unnamed protein product [Symbiodinium sp. CCMP2592]
MAVVFVKRGDDLVPCWVETGHIIDTEELIPLTKPDLATHLPKLSKSCLVSLIYREDGVMKDNSKDKQRWKMTKDEMVAYITEHWENILTTTTEVKKMFSTRRVVSDAMDKMMAPLETATKSIREDIGGDGKRTILLMNKYGAPTITTGFRVFYLQGLLHVSTAEGCYIADKDILTTENVVLLNRNDAEDDGEQNSVSDATQSSRVLCDTIKEQSDMLNAVCEKEETGNDSPTASEAEAMKQELLMQALTDCLPVPHRGMQFLLDNIGSCSLEVLRELLPDFTEAENTAVKMRKAIADCIEKLEGDQQGKPYTVFLLTEDGQETLPIFSDDTAESILTKYQATRHIPFTDPVIIGCDIENKIIGWTLRLKSVFSKFESDDIDGGAESGYGLLIMPRETYDYYVYENGIETDSDNENGIEMDTDTEDETQMRKKQSDMLNALCEKETGNTIDINTKGDITKPMEMEVQTEQGSVKLVFHYVVGATGENLFEALTEFGLDATLFQVKFAGTASVLQGYDSLEAYSDQTFQIVPLLAGGGKRGMSSEPRAKMSIEDKMRALTDAVNVAYITVQTTPTPASTDAMTMISTLKVQMDTAPNSIITKVFEGIPTSTLKVLSGASHTHNLDLKVSTMAKAIFKDKFNNLHGGIKSCQVAEVALKDMLHLMFLTQFGSAEQKGVSWNEVSSALVDMIEARASRTDADL